MFVSVLRKMADELDRVRISEAELRAEAASLIKLKDLEEDPVKKQRHRDCKRPDLQRYQPGAQTRRHRDGTDADKSSSTNPDLKMPVGSASDSDPKLTSSGSQSVPENLNLDCESTKVSSTHQDPAGSPVKVSKPSTSGSPKLRKTRKPDREIYQPGGRRPRGCKDSGRSTEAEPVSKESVKAEDVMRCKDVHEENAEGKGRRKRAPGVQSSANSDRTSVEIISDEMKKLNMSSSAVDPEKNKAKEGKHVKAKKISREAPENSVAGGEDETGEKAEKIKEKGKRRSRGGRERGSNQPYNTREEEEAVEKSPATNHRSRQDAQDKELQKAKPRTSHQRKGNADRRRASDGTEPSRAGFTSKRYSKSEIRRPRNRTYSTSSASSVNSANGRGEAERRADAGFRDSERDGGGAPKSHGVRNKRTVRNVSSTDSLDEHETVGRDGGKTARNDNGGLKTAKGNLGRSGGASQGGILRVTLNKQPVEDQTKHKDPGPRGRGRGILVLPTTSAEPGPRLMSGSRGGSAQGRGRGGRGGSTRRLWDPNNPDKKPALTGSTQSLSSPLQQPLYLQHQGGYGPLYFLDTDDECAGSPPMCQGEQFSSQHAAAMAYYKYQNSDNPYRYPLPSGAPNTPPRFTYSYPYQVPGSNGMYPSPAAQFYGAYAHGAQGYPSTGLSVSPEETEGQTRGELSKLLRMADSQELQLSNLLSRERLSRDGLDRMAQLRAELLTLYERVILTDIEFSDSQNVDQSLWKNVFYQVIERFRQLLKDQDADTAPQMRPMLLTLLEEGTLFFDSLLQKLQAVFQFKLEDYMDGMAIRSKPLRKTVKYALISAQRCMICQGDIARYREQASDSANYGKARSWYLKAQQIAPKNGRPYNQLALLAVYTKRKLDAVYYYMRSLAASNPILTAKESLMSLFEEAKRKAEQIERREKQNAEGGTRGPRGRGPPRDDDATRVEIWIRPSGGASYTAGSGSGKDSAQDGGLSRLSASDLNKRFILSFLHAHGKLFTKVGMESFPAVASRVLQEFQALLQHSPSPLGSTRMLQIITINMFTIHFAQSRAKGQGDTRSVLEEQSTSLGLAMFGHLVQRCTDLLKRTPAELIPVEELDESDPDAVQSMVPVSSFPSDLRELLPSVKVWSDWMLGHPEQWNPPLPSFDASPDVWPCLAELCNSLARVHHGEAPLYKADADGGGDEELRLLVLEEDRMLAGFVPLLAAPQEPCYMEPQTDAAMAADCKRVTVLKYFLEALCGQEEPLLAFKGGKYISIALSPAASQPTKDKRQEQSQEDDVIVEENSLSASEGEMDAEMDGDGNEDDIRELRARRHALAHRLAQQQKRRDKIQAVLQTGGQLELEIRPFYLVPDTNAFIDHLQGLKKLLACGSYVVVVPLIVITELDGLAKGQESRDRESAEEAAHARLVQESAKAAVTFLEKGFESREPGLRALTSRGSQLESIAFRSEDTSGHKGNNDDVILSCCLHYCQDKAKDFMPAQRDGPVRLRREVVLLTDDRNLRVKALTRNVPVRDIPAFLSWANVG